MGVTCLPSDLAFSRQGDVYLRKGGKRIVARANPGSRKGLYNVRFFGFGPPTTEATVMGVNAVKKWVAKEFNRR